MKVSLQMDIREQDEVVIQPLELSLYSHYWQAIYWALLSTTEGTEAVPSVQTQVS